MKYEIPQDRLDKILFKYLDNTLKLKGLEKRKPKYYKGFIFAYPDKEYGILGWKNNGDLYVDYELIDEISNWFSLEENDSKELIDRWASDRLQIEVKNTKKRFIADNRLLAIDYK